MSLYNSIFGTNPFVAVFAEVLQIESLERIPRFRDIFLSEDTPPHIVIYTRTGGGNREMYESRRRYDDNFPDPADNYSGPFNEDLHAIPGYLFDVNDEFDSTYARFHYSVPEPLVETMELLKTFGAGDDPHAKFEGLLAKLNDLTPGEQSDDPQVQHAIEVGKKLTSAIQLHIDLTQGDNDNGAK